MNTTKVIFQKHGFRQTQQGVVVSYLVDPVDMPDKLATDPLGTMYGAVLVEVDENDEAVEDKKPKRSFHDIPRSQQAGILCGDLQFQEWFLGTDYGYALGTEEAEKTTAMVLRHRGKVESRSEFDTSDAAAAWWDDIAGQYRRETGQEPESRG